MSAGTNTTRQASQCITGWQLFVCCGYLEVPAHGQLLSSFASCWRSLTSLSKYQSHVDHLAASSARDIRELVSQLRSVNNRLSTLERRAATNAASDETSHDAGSSSLAKPTYTHPPPAPFGVSKVTDNALAHSASAQPMGWLARIADTLSFRTFLGGLGAGIFSTTTAATLAAFVVFYIRKKKL